MEFSANFTALFKVLLFLLPFSGASNIRGTWLSPTWSYLTLYSDPVSNQPFYFTPDALGYVDITIYDGMILQRRKLAQKFTRWCRQWGKPNLLHLCLFLMGFFCNSWSSLFRAWFFHLAVYWGLQDQSQQSSY